MASAFVRILVGLFSIAVGIGMYVLWPQFRPTDAFTTRLGVALISMIAVFFAGLSMTKGGGD